MSNIKKQCTKCTQLLPLSAFTKQLGCKYNVRPNCKICKRKQDLIYAQKNRRVACERARQHYAQNRSKKIHYQKNYYIAHKKEILPKRRAYANTIPQKLKKAQYDRIYRQKHKKRMNKNLRARRLSNPTFLLTCLLRSRISNALRRNKTKKVGSAIKDLGCTAAQLKAYLTLKFQPGMTWENHGQFGWHVDHIRPLCTFNLEDLQQFAAAVHYTNLQPLWWRDNLTKRKA